MKLLRYALLAGLLAGAVGPTAQAQTFRTERGHVQFTSRVPLHTFSGTSDHLVGLVNLADSTLDFYVDLSTLKTGNAKRDKDMRKTLGTDSHPFGEFVGRLVSAFDTASTEPQQAVARGTFTIHGVSREIEVGGTLQFVNGTLLLETSWTLRLDDYDITPPRLLIIKVDEQQEINARAVLEPVDD